MSMSEITVDIEFLDDSIVSASIPGDYQVEEIISEVIAELDLPLLTDDRQPISYRFLHLQHNHYLLNAKTLPEAGVRDGDTLKLVPSHNIQPKAHTGIQPKAATVVVVLAILDLNRIESISLDADIPVGNLIWQICRDYHLPDRDGMGQKIKYKLRSKALGSYLLESMTLSQAGVPVLDRLVLDREELAGGGPMVFIPDQPIIKGIKRRFKAWMMRAAHRLGRLPTPLGVRYDSVDCTVFAPPTAPQGYACLIQVFAHRPRQSLSIKSIAEEFDRSAKRRGFKSLEMEIARGAKLAFHLTMRGIEIEHAVQSITWHGESQSVQFSLFIPETQKLGDNIGTVTIIYEQIPLGHIKFILTVTGAEQYSSYAVPVGSTHVYKKAFISYASQDRREVLKRVQILSILRIETFQDVLNLEPGVRWEKQLYRYIEESDLFLLFWSNAARRSEWVLKEIQYALMIKNGDDLALPDIIPVLIEGPPPIPPPEELSHLHFNDYILYLIANS